MSRVWIAILVLLLALAGTSLWLHRSLGDAREQLGAMVVQAEAREARLAALEAHLGALGRDIQAINQRSVQRLAQWDCDVLVNRILLGRCAESGFKAPRASYTGRRVRTVGS